MQRREAPTFRPTVWPADLPEVPPLLCVQHVLVEDGLYERAGVPDEVELPPDFVLHELRSTSGPSDDDLLAFVNTWGPLVEPGLRAFDVLGGIQYAGARRRLGAAQERLGRDDLVPIEALHAAARTLRILSGHLLAHLEGADDTALLEAWSTEGRPMDDLSDAWFHWEKHLNRGLAPFTVHVRAALDTGTGGRSRPNLYSACCLQLVQYVGAEAAVKRCANDRCGRPFTLQRGRARDEYGQHRSRGVRYCSHLCAKAQSERDRRRRRASEAESASGVDVTAATSQHHDEDRTPQQGSPKRGSKR